MIMWNWTFEPFLSHCFPPEFSVIPKATQLHLVEHLVWFYFKKIAGGHVHNSQPRGNPWPLVSSP